MALCLSVGMRFYSKLMPVICFTQLSWVRRHCFTIVMLGFIIYFFIFSFFVGIYKPQLKKEYEMILYDGGWYYVWPDIMIVLFCRNPLLKITIDLLFLDQKMGTLMKLLW